MFRMRRSEPRRYDGQVAVVSGASSGIGRQLALDLAARGATVVGLARRQPLLDELAPRLRGLSPHSSTRRCDVGDTASYQGVLAETEAALGRIDILVNNAAIEKPTPVTEGMSRAYRDILEVNFFAIVAGTLAVVPGMERRGSGTVVNVSSDSSRAPEPAHGAYSASKAAVSAFTECVAHEVFANGVRVHVLYPAWVPTAMGMSGMGANAKLPPRTVRRTEAQISSLVLDRMGGERIEINAAALPLLAPIGRAVAPVPYQRAIRGRAASHGAQGRD